MEFEISSATKTFQIKKAWYVLILIIVKGAYLFAGLWIFFYLKDYCLFNANSNIVVTIYLSVISLACFQGIGIPVSKFINVDLLKTSVGV